MLWLTERVTRYSIGVTMPEGYGRDAMEAGLVCDLDKMPSHLLRSVTCNQGSKWACWGTIAGGSLGGWTSARSTRQTSITPPRSSTTSDGTVSTTRVRPLWRLLLPCSDREHWPSRL